jgi:hypothetical protein
MRAASYLRILNTELPPDQLSRLVGLEPDKSWKKGELRRLQGGQPLRKRQPFNGVSFESGLDDQKSATSHFAALVERLRPYAEKIAQVASLPTTKSTRIWVVEHTERDMIDAFLDPDHVAVAAAMRAELTFSAYFYDDSE